VRQAKAHEVEVIVDDVELVELTTDPGVDPRLVTGEVVARRLAVP
jgi:hypothetical protein